MIAAKKKCAWCGYPIVYGNEVVDGEVKRGTKVTPVVREVCADCLADHNAADKTLSLQLNGELLERANKVRKESRHNRRGRRHLTHAEWVGFMNGARKQVYSTDGGMVRHGHSPLEDDEPMQACGLCVINPSN